MAAALITALVGLVGLLIAYVLGKDRAQRERLYEKRAEVIARISELLLEVQNKYAAWTLSFGIYEERNRRELIQEAGDTFAGFIHYARSHSIWLSPELNGRIEAFIDVAWDIGTVAGTNLDDYGDPDEELWEEIQRRVKQEFPALRQDLEVEFRKVLYPPPIYAGALLLLADVLERARSGRRSG